MSSTTPGTVRIRTIVDATLTPAAADAVSQIDPEAIGAFAQYAGALCLEALGGAAAAKGIDIGAIDGADISYTTTFEYGAAVAGGPATPPAEEPPAE